MSLAVILPTSGINHTSLATFHMSSAVLSGGLTTDYRPIRTTETPSAVGSLADVKVSV